jgi:hypothetical protein
MPTLPEHMRANLPDLPLFLRPADNLLPLTVGTELFIGGEEDEEVNIQLPERVPRCEWGL